MAGLKILAISCNWGPYACYDSAGRAGLKLPPGFKMIRIMCLGRLSPALLLKAFESGADGVILLRCRDEECRYGADREAGRIVVQETHDMLHLLGLGRHRLQECRLAPNDRQRFAAVIWEFADRIKDMGINPVRPRRVGEVS